MTNKQYSQCLIAFKEIADCQLFFTWLEENPHYIGLSDIEIEINFMMRCVAHMAYAKGQRRW
jgi:hypothetical protein